MTKFPSFEQVYPRIEAHMDDMQKKRDEYKKKMIRNLLIAVGLWALMFIVGFIDSSGKVTIALFFTAIIGSVVLFIMSASKIKLFRHQYKSFLINETLQQIFALLEPTNPEDAERYKYFVKYFPEKRIHTRHIRKTNLLGQFDRVNGEDYTSGRIGVTDFEFSELHLQNKEEYTDSKGNRKTRIKTVFKGVAFMADFHKNFNGRTYLIRKSWFNTKKFSLRFTGARPIELEDVDFNKTFETMATDDIEARYILSSNLMQRIMEYTDQAHGPVQIAFVDSRMYILTETKKDLFEGRFWRSDDEKTLKIIYDEFMVYFNIIEAFTLNRRIWSKQ